MLELAGSSVVDWVQGLVTKALCELQVSKHKTGQYAHNIIISSSYSVILRVSVVLKGTVVGRVEKRKLAVFFDLPGKLNVGVLFVEVIVESVNFVF